MAIFDIRNFGAVGDGRTNNTSAINAALEQCKNAGGGVVLIEDGDYVTGAIRVYDNTTLKIEAGAVLHGRPAPADS